MWVDRDGVGIHGDVAGTGPPVLLTHGFAASSHMFAAVVERLTPSYTVVTWDLRGHGSSASPADPGAYSVPLAVGDMVAVLDAAGAERTVLVGHSLGGYLSLELALLHPERVAGLVLVGTGPGYRDGAGRAGWNEMVERYARALEQRGLDALPGGEELRADVHRGAGGLVRAARGILRQHDGHVLEALPTIAVPTLVVVGDRDQPFLASSRYMAGKVPGARLAVIPGAGHAPMVSHPDAFATEVAPFLAAATGHDG